MKKRESTLLGNLETIAWGMNHFGSLHTNRQFPISTMMRLVRDGLAQSCGMGYQCDGDGGIMWERRQREGFDLTYLGAFRLVELREIRDVATGGAE